MQGSCEYFETLKINYTLKGCFIASNLSNKIIRGRIYRIFTDDEGDMVDGPRAVKMQ